MYVMLHLFMYPFAVPAFRIISDTLYEVNEADGTAEVAVTVIGAVLTFDIEVTVNTTTGGSATGNKKCGVCDKIHYKHHHPFLLSPL